MAAETNDGAGDSAGNAVDDESETQSVSGPRAGGHSEKNRVDVAQDLSGARRDNSIDDAARDTGGDTDGVQVHRDGMDVAEPPARRGMSRRGLLLGGVGALAAGVGAGVVIDRSRSDGASNSNASAHTVDFYGEHQAGIVTPAQDRLYFATFDVITDDVDELEGVLSEWSEAAARMTQGLEAAPDGATGGSYLAPPADTGEALGLAASDLTVTFGVGKSLFADENGRDRLGLAAKRPDGLIDLPHFPADRLDPARSGGDLCVQACANDPQVAFHAVRNLARIGFGVVSMRWSQLGFGRTSSTSTAQTTPRNLFGFKDGTANLKAEQGDLVDEFVWVHPDDETGAGAWLVGGSYLVVRRISMHIETWDRTSLAEQEAVVGRTKLSGAPLSGGDEMTPVDIAVEGRDGPLVPVDSHVALALPENNGGAQMLRRGYNFTDGSDHLGRLDAGLFFLSYVRDVPTQFVAIQNKLSAMDTMMEYIVHTGSALFAVLPGAPKPGVSVFAPLLA